MCWERQKLAGQCLLSGDVNGQGKELLLHMDGSWGHVCDACYVKLSSLTGESAEELNRDKVTAEPRIGTAKGRPWLS